MVRFRLLELLLVGLIRHFRLWYQKPRFSCTSRNEVFYRKGSVYRPFIQIMDGPEKWCNRDKEEDWYNLRSDRYLWRSSERPDCYSEYCDQSLHTIRPRVIPRCQPSQICSFLYLWRTEKEKEKRWARKEIKEKTNIQRTVHELRRRSKE